MSKIHASVMVSPTAKIGNNVSIGPYSIIGSNVIIGDDCIIDSYCELGYTSDYSDASSLQIGANSHIRSHSVFYSGSHFGDGLVTGHHVTVRSETRAGRNLQIGTLSDIQGKCIFGDYVRLHSNVHVGQGSKVGSFVWLYPYVVLTNDPHPPSDVQMGVVVEDYAVVSTMSVVLPGVTVGSKSLVGAHSLVNRDVNPEMLVMGIPAREICPASKIKLKDGTNRDAYPWMNHFSRSYPLHVVREWR